MTKLLDVIDNDTRNHRSACKWRTVHSQLTDSEREAVDKLMAGGYPKLRMAENLTAADHPISEHVIRKHFNGVCSCD